MAARKLYVLAPHKADGPVLKVRNADRRNKSRLNKRLNRFIGQHNRVVYWTMDNGTLVAAPEEVLITSTVKREIEKLSKVHGRPWMVLP
jgi:hypothetical protein